MADPSAAFLAVHPDPVFWKTFTRNSANAGDPSGSDAIFKDKGGGIHLEFDPDGGVISFSATLHFWNSKLGKWRKGITQNVTVGTDPLSYYFRAYGRIVGVTISTYAGVGNIVTAVGFVRLDITGGA